jgi:PhnB protein
MAEKQDGVRVPLRYSRVDPWVISPDTDAEIAFLTEVFDATETPGSRMLDAEGRIGHVEVEIGGSVIMMFDAHPEWPATPAHLRVYVGDAQRTFEQAMRAGSRAVTEPTRLAFGERVARVRDPQGHLWWIHEHVEDVDPDDLGSRFAHPAAQESLTYVQQTLAEELSRASD